MTDQTTAPTADLTADEMATRLRRILHNTPQARSFHFHGGSTNADLLNIVEQVMTVDYGQALRDLADAREAIAKLTRERQIVREFFGVTA